MSKLTLEDAIRRFEEKFKLSAQISQEGKFFIPGGYSRSSVTFGDQAVYAERGEGAYLYTIDGERMLDCHNNFTVNVTGHNHPHLIEALQDAVSKGFSFANPMRHEHQLAKMLCERIGSIDRVIFSCSASESCLTAIRIARANTNRPKIAKFEGGYHGFADEFMISVHPDDTRDIGPDNAPLPDHNTKGAYPQVKDNVLVLPQNDLESCTRILGEHASELACVIVELMANAGGPIVLEQDFVLGLREITRELGILLIVDETVTARSCFHGMQANYGIEADLTVLGKAIGGGLPLGAVGGKKKYFDIVEQGDVHHSGTHHGHPLATAAGIANLEIMDEAACERLNASGDHIIATLSEWANDNDYLFKVYGTASSVAYIFPDQAGRQYRSVRDLERYCNKEAMSMFAFEMANQGIYVLERGSLSLSEPMTQQDIEAVIGTTKRIVGSILS